MKKFLVIVAALLVGTVSAIAQPKAIGARMGNFQASYEHYLGGANFIEGDFGASLYPKNGVVHTGADAAVSYNFVFLSPSWTYKGEWNWYAGPGVALGQGYYYVSEHPDCDGHGSFYFGVLGQVGLEYTFWFPLQLSADLRTVVGTMNGELYARGLTRGLIPTISVRYAF